MTTPGPEQQPYQGGGYTPMPPAGPGAPQAQQARQPRNGFGVTALVLGILALVLCWTVLGGIILGVLALIFGIVGLVRANRGEATNKGMSISGIVTGAIGLVVGIIFAVAVGSFLSLFGQQISDFQDCVNQANGDQAQIMQCRQQYQQDIQDQLNQ